MIEGVVIQKVPTSRSTAQPIEMPWRTLAYWTFRRKWTVLAIFILTSGAVGLFSIAQPRVYRAETKFLVRLGRESVAVDPLAQAEQVRESGAHVNELFTKMEILRSHDMAEKVVDRLGTFAILQPEAYADATADAAGDAPNVSMQERVARGLRRTLDAAEAFFGAPAMNDGRARMLAAQAVSKGLVMHVLPDTSVIYVAYETTHPLVAQRVLQEVAQVYLEEEQHSAYRTVGAVSYLQAQVQDLSRKLEQTENELAARGYEMGKSTLQDPMAEPTFTLAALDREIATLQAELKATQGRLKRISQRLPELDGNDPSRTASEKPVRAPDPVRPTEEPAEISPAPDLTEPNREALLAELQQFHMEEQTLLRKYTETSPPVQAVRRNIRAVERMLAQSHAASESEQVTRARNELRTRMDLMFASRPAAAEPVDRGRGELKTRMEIMQIEQEGQLDASQTKLEFLLKQREDVQARIARLSELGARTRELLRVRRSQEVMLEKYVEKFEQARINEALQKSNIANVVMIQEPTFPYESVRPRKWVTRILGVLLGLGLAGAYVAVSGFMNRTVVMPQEIESRLGLPVLATVPRTRTELAFPAATGGAPAGEDPHIAIDGQMRVSIEALGARLLAGDGKTNARVIAVVGTAHRGGTSAVASNLAVILADLSDGPVLLVDANWKHPALHKMLGVDQQPGLDEFLQGGSSVASAAHIYRNQTLYVLTAGGHPADLTMQARQQNLVNVLALWRGLFRYVILDLPALTDAPAVVRIARAADATLYVVPSESVRFEAVKHGKEQLEQAGAKIMGVVLNRHTKPIPAWVYARV